MSNSVQVSVARSIALSLLALLFLGCAAESVPSEATAKNAYSDYLTRREDCAGLVLTKFQKTNGRKAGDGQYVVSFEAEVTIPGHIGSSVYPCTGFDIDYDMGSDNRLQGTTTRTKTLKGELLLAMTEKGWQIQRAHVSEHN